MFTISNLVISPAVINTAPAFAASTVAEGATIHDLTHAILRKEIDLERYYIRYRVSGSKEPKFRNLRYFLLQQAAAGLTLSANISGLHLFRPKKQRNPEEIPIRGVRKAITTGLIGILIEGGSSGFEICSNGMLAIKNKLKKNDPQTARDEVHRRIREIDALFAQRNKLVEQHKNDKAFDAYVTEGNLLKYVRNWCLYEFATIYADIKSYQASNNVYYGLDVAASSIYTASYILSLNSLKRPLLARDSAVTGIIGDSIGIVSAPGSAYSYNVMYKYWFGKLEKHFGEKLKDAEMESKKEYDKLEKMLVDADIAQALGPEQIRSRMAVYELWERRYDQVAEKELLDLRHSSKVALQSNISGPLISGAFLAQDILGTYASYKLDRSPKKATSVAFAASVPTTVASGASIALSTYWFIDHKLHRRRLAKQDALPEDLLDKRLKTLDELESMLHN
jgi:hypothetical protein